MASFASLRRSLARARALASVPQHFDFPAAEILAFSPPDYLGVSGSTRTLFDHWQGLHSEDVATGSRRRRWADAVAEAGARIVILSGFEDGYAEAAALLRSRHPGTRVFALWHGSSLQLADATERRHLETLLELARTRVVDRIGFLKQGMDSLFDRLGAPSYRLMNYVAKVPDGASLPARSDETSLGLWFAGVSWRKNPYAMLCAASLIPDARIEGVLDTAALDWCRRLELRLGEVRQQPLAPAELAVALARQHCNLYVTLSECSPLLPLESLAAGAPCLVAPNSHLFEDDAQLSEALVVTRIDDPHAIADRARAAVADRSGIVAAYARHAPGYNARACELRDRFLED